MPFPHSQLVLLLMNTHTFAGTVNFDIVGSDISEEISTQLAAVGQSMAKAQIVDALEKLGQGVDPSQIAGEIRNGGSNA